MDIYSDSFSVFLALMTNAVSMGCWKTTNQTKPLVILTIKTWGYSRWSYISIWHFFVDVQRWAFARYCWRCLMSVMAHQQQGETARLNSAWRKASTEGFRCVASDRLFQSVTVLGKNEYLKGSMRHDMLMKACSEADLVVLVECLKWSIVEPPGCALSCTSWWDEWLDAAQTTDPNWALIGEKRM
jgi:hypothetical protein